MGGTQRLAAFSPGQIHQQTGQQSHQHGASGAMAPALSWRFRDPVLSPEAMAAVASVASATGKTAARWAGL
jgi:hypothetical protein